MFQRLVKSEEEEEKKTSQNTQWKILPQAMRLLRRILLLNSVHHPRWTLRSSHSSHESTVWSMPTNLRRHHGLYTPIDSYQVDPDPITRSSISLKTGKKTELALTRLCYARRCSDPRRRRRETSPGSLRRGIYFGLRRRRIGVRIRFRRLCLMMVLVLVRVRSRRCGRYRDRPIRFVFFSFFLVSVSDRALSGWFWLSNLLQPISITCCVFFFFWGVRCAHWLFLWRVVV